MEGSAELRNVIASNINHQLSKHHMSRPELAKKVGVSTAAVGFWCNGTKIPRMDKVDRMCEIFECRRIDILSNPSEIEADRKMAQLLRNKMHILNEPQEIQDQRFFERASKDREFMSYINKVFCLREEYREQVYTYIDFIMGQEKGKSESHLSA